MNSDLSIIVKDIHAAVKKIMEELGGISPTAFVCRNDEVWVTPLYEDDEDENLALNELIARSLPRLIDLVRQVEADRVILVSINGIAPVLSREEALAIPDQERVVQIDEDAFILMDPTFAAHIIDMGTFGTKVYSCPIEYTDDGDTATVGNLEECEEINLGIFEPLRELVQEFGLV